MSEPTESPVGVSSKTPELIRMPTPFFPKAQLPTDEHGNYKPVDPLDRSVKCFLVSGLLLTAWHLRRVLELRKGSQRPGIERYYAMFQTTPRQIIGIPVAIGVFQFLSDCFKNLAEEERGVNAFIAASTSTFIGLAIIGCKPLSKHVGISFGLGCFYGLSSWAGSFYGLENRSFKEMFEAGKIRRLEETKKEARADKQGFWEPVYRRPLSQTLEDLGVNQHTLKP